MPSKKTKKPNLLSMINGLETDYQELLEAFHNSRSDFLTLQSKVINLTVAIEKMKEQMRMPIDFRLTQAKNSLVLLTSFLNEIQRDLEKKYEAPEKNWVQLPSPPIGTIDEY